MKNIFETHFEELVSLNNEEVPSVNHLEESEFAELAKNAAFSEVLLIEEGIAGLVLGFEKDNQYEGFNFQWFCSRFDDFLYIDRIIASKDFRGQGVGKRLYDLAINYCKNNGLSKICCEVNNDPPNPGSHAFHKKMGFEPIEEVLHPEGKTVQMYVLSLVNV